MEKRFVVLVLDGFGVGEMPDVPATRPQDVGAHTFRNIMRANPNIHIPTFRTLGIVDYYVNGHYKPTVFAGKNVSFGKSRLAHFGADSFVGHQEIAGTRPKMPVRQFVRDVHEMIVDALRAKGYDARFDGKVIVVDTHMAVADNIETDYGLNINVVGSLDHMPFDRIENAGKAVRDIVKVGRVITMGGVGMSQDSYYRCFEIKERDGYTAWGINIPKLNIYNDSYRVVHMGYGISPDTQTPQILALRGVPVTLIGKTADVIRADGAEYLPNVYTDKVLDALEKRLSEDRGGFIFANVQETDLSGHQEDVGKYSKYLEMVDERLPQILSLLAPNDNLIITGDHGNDPTIGHTNHTREFTPVVLFSNAVKSADLGERTTLSDIGATASAYFGAPQPEHGTPLVWFHH